MISLDEAPELEPYRDEPAQLPSAAPGKVGALRLTFERRTERTELVDLFRQAPLLVQRALYWDTAMPEMACVYMISTSGGMLQGDRQEIDVSLGEGAHVHLTTQSATKIHQMDANYAAQVQQITVADDAYLEYLPQPIIPYRGSRFIAYTEITLPESATMLYAEILMPGRKHREDGEVFEYDLFSTTLRVARPNGTDLFVEKSIIDPARFGVARRGVLNGFHVFGSVVLLTSRERATRVYEKVPSIWDQGLPLAAGVNRLPNYAGLSYKILGMERAAVQDRVREFGAVAREECVGRATGPSFSWR
jgi:urease accessory protein